VRASRVELAGALDILHLSNIMVTRGDSLSSPAVPTVAALS
jgi:hypothetical protein